MTTNPEKDTRATPLTTAQAAGLWRGFGRTSTQHLTWDHVLDRAVLAYWQRRSQPHRDAA